MNSMINVVWFFTFTWKIQISMYWVCYVLYYASLSLFGMHLFWVGKAQNRMPRELSWKTHEKRRVQIAYIWAIKDMYDRVTTSENRRQGHRRFSYNYMTALRINFEPPLFWMFLRSISNSQCHDTSVLQIMYPRWRVKRG